MSPSIDPTGESTVILVHGAWLGEWCWQRVRSLLRVESVEAEQWVQIIERNLADLIRTGSPFKIIDNIVAVYGDTLGLARETHVRRAVKNLHATGLSKDDGKGDDFYKRLIRG